jgi:DNA-binding NarL/FixJ family response regulator
MIDIAPLVKIDIKFPENKTENLAYYTLLARHLIAEHAPGYIAREMLKSDDAIANMVTALALADVNWNPNKPRNRFTFRKRRVLWEISRYIARKIKNKHKTGGTNSLSIHNASRMKLNSLISRESVDSLDQLVQQEEKESLAQYIRDHKLTDKQEKYLIRYLEGASWAEIGREYGISRQAVQHAISDVVYNIRKNLNP